MKKTIATTALLASVLGMAGVAIAAQASAIGGNCTAWAEKQVIDWAPDKWRVGARCSSLQADSKARGIGDVDGPDHQTAWFTTLNTNRYSSWGTGGIDRSRVEIAHI